MLEVIWFQIVWIQTLFEDYWLCRFVGGTPQEADVTSSNLLSPSYVDMLKKKKKKKKVWFAFTYKISYIFIIFLTK
jgi:hypothetical protein